MTFHGSIHTRIHFQDVNDLYGRAKTLAEDRHVPLGMMCGGRKVGREEDPLDHGIVIEEFSRETDWFSTYLALPVT